jgi:WD40 repeat protein
MVAAGALDGSYTVWNATAGRAIASSAAHAHLAPELINVRRDVIWLGFSQGKLVSASRGKVQIDSVTKQSLTPESSFTPPPGGGRDRIADIYPNRKLLALLDRLDNVAIWDFSGKQLAKLNETPHHWNTMAFDPEGSTLWMGTSDGLLLGWNWQNGSTSSSPCSLPGQGPVSLIMTLANSQLAVLRNSLFTSCKPLRMPVYWSKSGGVTAAVSPDRTQVALGNGSGEIRALSYVENAR